MGALAKRYLAASLSERLVIGSAAAVILNAIYCLVYRYASGNPATLFEAFSWGIINIAPWIAAFEIGRETRSQSSFAAIFAAALVLSLGLQAVLYLSWPTSFDLVRRIPAALLIAAALAALFHWDRRREVSMAEAEAPLAEHCEECDWAMSAGNYVEMHNIGEPPRLVRSTLKQVIEDAGSGLVQVHRRYAVHLRSIHQVERTYVVLHDGTRVPIGDRYRAKVLNNNSLVPSSQTS